MKTEAYVAGTEITMMCSGCDGEQQHTIETVTKLGKITKAVCTTCGTASTFNRGVKTSVSGGKAPTAAPYDRYKKYRKGQAMMHATFGRGEVTALVGDQKIDVLFGESTRRLIHAQN